MATSISVAAMDRSDGKVFKLFDWRILPMLAITALVLGVLWTNLVGAADFSSTLRGAEWSWIGLAAGLMGVNLLTGTVRLQLVIGSMGHRLPFLRSLDAILATWPLAVITPSRASDVLRAVAIRDICPPWEGSGGVVAEKMVDVQSLCLLAIVGSALYGIWQATFVAAAMLVAEWIFVIFFVFGKRYENLPVLKKKADKLGRVLRVFEAFRERPGYFLAVSATSLMAWILAVGIVVSLFHAFGAVVPFSQALALWPLSIFVGMLPLTVAGMGTRDAAFLSLLALSTTDGVQEAPVLAGTFGYALLTAWTPALLGIPFMLRHMAQFRAAKATDVNHE